MSGETYLLNIDGQPAEITKLDTSPEELVTRLSKNEGNREKANLLVFGEDHEEFAMREKVTGIIKANKNLVGNLYREISTDEQKYIDAYFKPGSNKNDEANFYENIIYDYAQHAPDKTHTQLRKQYFAANANMYEIAKEAGISCIAFDPQCKGEIADTSDKEDDLEADIRDLKMHHRLFSSFFNNNDLIDNFESYSKNSYAAKIKEVQADLSSEDRPYSVSPDLMDNKYSSPKITKEKFYELCKEIGVDTKKYDIDKIPYNIFTKYCDDKIDELETKRCDAFERNMFLRNPIMADNIISNIKSKAEHNDKLNVAVVGRTHCVACPEKAGDMIQSLNDKAKTQGIKLKVVTIDIVSADKSTMDKYGSVFVGGKSGADFTIFVEGKRTDQDMKDLRKIHLERSRNSNSPYIQFLQPEPQQNLIEQIYHKFFGQNEQTNQLPNGTSPINLPQITDRLAGAAMAQQI